MMRQSHTASASLWIAALLGALMAFGTARAQQDPPGREEKTAESEVTLPAAPQKTHLLPFYVSPTTTMDFAIDATSVSVSPDGIVRYTMVITSKAGASNVSYEGIRCSSMERKLYATGKPDGSWSLSRRDAWLPIGEVGANRQHAALAKDYFCEGGTIAGKAQTIVERIRKQKPLK